MAEGVIAAALPNPNLPFHAKLNIFAGGAIFTGLDRPKLGLLDNVKFFPRIPFNAK
ncbi:MAG: hypothetical protein PW788_10900 [Micavibrio sp.]|nr:hypothetical protein [Micavibrio sp.]